MFNLEDSIYKPVFIAIITNKKPLALLVDPQSLTVPGVQRNLPKYEPLKVHKQRDFNKYNPKAKSLQMRAQVSYYMNSKK